jgi:hypothetical protein
MQTFLHAIDFNQWIVPYSKFYEGVCGGQMAGHPVSFYCIDFTLTIAMSDGDHTTTGGASAHLSTEPTPAPLATSKMAPTSWPVVSYSIRPVTDITPRARRYGQKY